VFGVEGSTPTTPIDRTLAAVSENDVVEQNYIIVFEYTVNKHFPYI
jgi:hypothetical protein